MRFKTVVCLLALAAGDCLLWHWSIAGEHDIAALVTGLALLPLIALGLGGLLLTCARLLTRASSHSPSMTSLSTAARSLAPTAQQPASRGSALAEEDARSRRLAA